MSDDTVQVSGFLSYAHHDSDWMEHVRKSLKRLELEGKLDLWFDGRLTAGDPFRKTIAEKVTHANIILLLVSEHFLASRFSYEEELRCAIARQQEGEARIVPILLRDCDWQDSWFGGFQVLPSGALPLERWKHMEEGLLDVAQGVAGVVRQIAGNLPKHDPELALFSVGELREIIGTVDRSLAVLRKALASLPTPSSNQLIEIDQLEQRRYRYQSELRRRGYPS